MITRSLPALLAATLLLAGAAPGQEKLPPPEAPPQALPPAPVPDGPACAPDCHGPPRTVAVPRVHIVERQEATTLPELKLREEVVSRCPATTLEVGFREERRVVPDVELRPRVVEQCVTCYTTRPVKEVDPCTGKECIVHKPVPEVKTVKVTVYDCVPVERIVVVRVPVVKENPAELVVKRLVLDVNTVPAIRKTYEGIFLKDHVDVPPPAPVPPLPCLPSGCHK